MPRPSTSAATTPGATPLILALAVLVACQPTTPPAARSVRGFPADALDSLGARERVLSTTPDTALIREYARIMSEAPHHAGSPGAKAVAEWALGKFREWGLDAQIEEFQALLPTPISRSVELVAPSHYVAVMAEPVLSEDKDSGDQGQLPTYNAYGADGDVQGELVFANYGLAEDYAHLDSLGVDLRGKIVIVKYGRGVRSSKIKQAVARGAIGCLIYSDPKDDGFTKGDVYPKGPWRPDDGVQRGTALDYAAAYAGDPLSPGWGSVKGAKRLPISQAKSLPGIPVLPLSYKDAKPLLEAIGGPSATTLGWAGGLPIEYHVGPGPARVRMQSKSDWKTGTLYDVVARIPGSTLPDEWVVMANHHDGWVNGAADPVGAAAAMLESARAFSQLLKSGWKPQRTMIFALWDGEEWGLLGSTEWAEAHATELQEKAVAYLNTDMYGKGVFGADGSHTLETYVREVARDNTDPGTGKSMLDASVDRALANAKSAKDSAAVKARGFRLSAPGSGTDFEAFLEHLGIATVSHSLEGGEFAGTYHSIYDSYDNFSRFLDPGFRYGAAQARVVGSLAVRMSEAPILPFSFSDAAAAYREFAAGAVARATQKLGSEAVDMSAVMQSVDRLASAGAAYDSAYGDVIRRGSAYLAGHRDALRALNRELYLSERDLLDPRGLPGREWFKSTMYATGLYTGFEGDPMPGVGQMIDDRNAEAARNEAAKVAAAIDRMAGRAERATARLRELPASR
ncbi:MAG: M28 family peptidase [Gemmatimonadaceae bacterium]